MFLDTTLFQNYHQFKEVLLPCFSMSCKLNLEIICPRKQNTKSPLSPLFRKTNVSEDLDKPVASWI